MTLAVSRPEDAFIDLIANAILGAITLSIGVKIAFWVLSSTVSTILPISLSIPSLKHLFKDFTFTAFSLVAKSQPRLPAVNSWSLVASMTVAFSCLSLALLPIITPWSKSIIWLRSLLFDCLFLQVETVYCFNKCSALQRSKISWTNDEPLRQKNNATKWQLQVESFSLVEESEQLLCSKIQKVCYRQFCTTFS